MDVSTIQKTLDFLENSLSEQSFHDVSPLLVDKWLAASILQKAIRRNDVQSALSAAFTLWHQDKGSFWRRLHTISVEDVGVASTDVITQTLTALNNPAWRRRKNDLKIGLTLTKLLCSSSKTRLADEVYTICNKSSDLQSFRDEIYHWNEQKLIGFALNANNDLPMRALCLWFIAGTKKFPSDTMHKRVGSLESAADILLALDAPADLTCACIGVMGKTQWPLVLFTPLLWGDVHRQNSKLTISSDQYPASPIVNGVPLFAMDMFTRSGRACFSELRRRIKPLQPFKIQQIGLAVFYSEGRCINPRARTEMLDSYRQDGEFADMEGVGLDIPEYLGLKDLIEKNMDLLNSLRREQLENCDFVSA